jgi:zinc transport system ATP-binding protein
MSMNVLAVRGLCVRYGIVEVLNDVEFDLAAGDFLALAGPNGSGKSTLVQCVLGLIPPARGRIHLFGRDFREFNQWFRVGYVPQLFGNPHPGFPATVRQIVASGRLAGKRFPKRLNGADRAAVDRVLDFIGIGKLSGRKIDRLSGGQRQRVFLARALVGNPELLLLDEPTAALDSSARADFYGLLEEIHRGGERTILMVTHDGAAIASFARTLLYLDRRVHFIGKPSDFYLPSDPTRRQTSPFPDGSGLPILRAP